jgi:hypothetical protein
VHEVEQALPILRQLLVFLLSPVGLASQLRQAEQDDNETQQESDQHEPEHGRRLWQRANAAATDYRASNRIPRFLS